MKAIERLISGASSQEEAINIVTGGEPLSEREKAILAAVRAFDTRRYAKSSDNSPEFNHEEKNIFPAIGLSEEVVLPKLKKLHAWAASYSILNDKAPSKSRIIERIYHESDMELERITMALLIG